MRYEIQYNNDIAHRLVRIIWKEDYNITYNPALKTLALSGGVFIGGFILTQYTFLGFVALFFSVAILWGAAIQYNLLKKIKHNVNHIHDSIKESGGTSTFVMELNEEYFMYFDELSELKIKWEYYNHYRIIDDFLFLCHSDALSRAFILPLTQTGHQSEILEFIKTKVKPHTPA